MLYPRIVIAIAIIFLFEEIQLPAAVVETKRYATVANHPKNIYQAVKSCAKSYREDTTLPSEQENLRQKIILEQAFSYLTKYDSQSSLENAVREFLQRELSLKEFGYTVVDANLTDIGGKSNDIVFLVRNPSGYLCYIIKAFRNPRDLSSKFLPEISALDLLQQLSLPGVGSIHPLAFASYTNQGEEWGLLLETAAKGQRIDQYVYQLANLDPCSKERELFLEICRGIFKRIGESFAKLHARKSFQPVFISKQDLEKYDNKLSKILVNPFIINEIEKRLSVDVFFQYVNKVKAEAIKIPIFYSFWHGDAHLGNMYYDNSEDIFYFIDLAKMHHSISYTGEPLLDGTMDLASIEENLHRKTLGLLSENEVKALLKSFYETYEEFSSEKIVQPILLFYKTYKKLGRLLTYARYIEEEDQIKHSTDQTIFDTTIKYFKTHLMDQEGHLN